MKHTLLVSLHHLDTLRYYHPYPIIDSSFAKHNGSLGSKWANSGVIDYCLALTKVLSVFWPLSSLYSLAAIHLMTGPEA